MKYVLFSYPGVTVDVITAPSLKVEAKYVQSDYSCMRA